MRIAILHLSDIHLKTSKDWILNKIPAIHYAVRPLADTSEFVFVVITGDLAYSGRAEEYSLAKKALERLIQPLQEEYPSLRIETVIVPGNHDCDFTNEAGVRAALLATSSKIVDQMNLNDDSIAKALLQPQDNFFNFLATVENATVRTGYQRLRYYRTFSVDRKTIRFDCFNTAWMSRIHEKPSELMFPIELIDEPSDTSDIVVSIFHHPTQWLEPTNARLFRTQIEYRSHIILTGHEHEPDQYTKQHDLTGEVSLYLEGDVLQNGKPKDSGFQTIEIDLESNEKRLVHYKWRRDSYVPLTKGEWTPLQAPKRQQDSRLLNRESYLQMLSDPGANFSHKSRATLQLSDIYVYPELTMVTFEKTAAETLVPIIDSEKVPQFVLDHPHLLIAGAEVSGKTALAKTLYKDLIHRGLAPLLLSGEQIKVTSSKDVSKLVERHLREQYEGDAVNSYVQKQKDLRVLIVDDFHKVKLNRDGRNAFLETSEATFGRIVLMVDAFFEFQEMTQPPSQRASLLRYSHAEISEFGHRLRYRLISKWVMLGQENTADEQQLSHTIDETADIVTTLLGRKVVPRFPIFIISMLQALDTNANLNAATGAFGYFYEVFILQSLSLHRTAQITMDMITTFLTWVGNRMFELRQMTLDEREWDDVTDFYFREYGVPFDRQSMINILVSAKIISRHGDVFEFKYKYVYYYFVAKHLATSLGSSSQRRKARKLVIMMTNNLNIEAFNHVIMFLVYLTKDEKTIAEILNRTREQYADFVPADLERDIDFLNALQPDLPKLALTDGNVDEHKDERLRQYDDVERTLDNNQNDENQDDYLDRKMDDAIRMDIALRTIQIAGQILRNFPGALPKKQKRELAREIHLLGLRILTIVFDVLNQNKDEFRSSFVTLVKKIDSQATEEEITRQAEQFLFLIGGGITFGILKTIAASIGSEHLKQIYPEALNDTPEIPTQLLDLSIKLDHFRPFPEKEVNTLSTKLSGNKLPLTVFQLLVRDHFHTEREDYRLRQRVCNRIGIEFRDQRMIEGKHKK